MRRFLIAVLIFFLIDILQAQTQVSGVIDTETWTKAGNPYQVVGDINVLQLTIEPGVEIEFKGNYAFEVSGYLKAKGTANDSIVFRAADGNANGWKGLYFNNASSQCAISYVQISDAAQNYGLKIYNCSLNFSQLAIKNNATTGVLVDNASLQLTHCFIQNNNDYGFEAVNGGDATLIACSLISNHNNGLHTNQGKITLKNSIVAHNKNEGILLSQANDELDAVNAVIACNQKEGILGVGVSDKITVNNSIVYFNKALNQIYNLFGTTNVTYSDVQDQDLGSTNLMTDPLFADTAVIFNLSENSPAIDAGDPSDEVNDTYFPPSLGGLRNDMGAYGGPLARKWYRPLFVMPESLAFGDVSVGDSMQSSVLLKNYGDAALTVNSVTVTGDDAAQFGLSPFSLPITIPMADSLRVPLIFHPGSARLLPFNAQLEIESSAENRSVALSGRGVAADILVLPTELHFSSTTVGERDSSVVKIYNLGTDTLRLDSVQVQSPVFAYRLSMQNLAPQSDTMITMTVYFAPDTIADYQSSLKIFSNDPDESPLSILVSGSGLASFLTINPLQVNYDSVHVGQDSVFTLLLSNVGNALLSVDSLELLQASSVFSIVDQMPIQLAAAANDVPLHIRFQADTAGYFTDTLRLVSNDPFRPERLIPLTAIAVAPYITVQPARIDFGTIIAPADSVLSLKIKNSGNVALHVKRFSLTGPDVASFIWWKNGEDLIINPKNDSLAVHLRCSPQRSGILQAQFNIISDDVRFDSLQVPIVVNVKASEMVLLPDTLQFPPTVIFDQMGQTVKIVNRGDYDLRIDSIKIAQINGPDFHFTELQFPQNIRPFVDTLNFPISFNPQITGEQSAQVQFFSNDPFVNPRTLTIQSNGVAPVLSVSEDTIDFGAVSVFRHPVKSVLLKSLGSAQVVIDSISIVGDPTQSFYIPNLSGTIRLAPSDSVELPVFFTPKSTGSFSAELKIHWNDPYNNIISIALKARADSADLQVPFSLNFGKHVIHSVSRLDVPVRNVSRVLLTIDSIRISGRDSAQFKLDFPADGFTLQSTDTLLKLPVEYVPHITGLHLAQLNIYSADLQQKVRSVGLLGVALSATQAPLLQSNLQDSVDFGSVFVDQSVQQPCYLMNLGNAPLTVDSLSLTGANTGDFALINAPAGMQIAPDDTLKTFALQFTPGAQGKRSALLKIFSNDAAQPMTLNLSGEGKIDPTPATVVPAFDTLQIIAGQPFTVSIQAFDDNTDVTKAEVYLRQGGEGAFHKFDLQKAGKRLWQTTLDSNLITIRGLVLYFKVYHGGSVTEYPENGIQNPMAVNVRLPKVQFPYAMVPQTYRMVSLPVNAGAQTLIDLFGDELGSYDPAQYRFFDWDAGQGTFIELSDMKEKLPTGKAMYLITADSVSLNIENATSVPCAQPFKLTLNKGWNMIGDPFTFPVDWQSVEGNDGLTLYYFNGAAWEIVHTLEPFKGYAVKVQNAVILQVPPVATVQSVAKPLARNHQGWRFRLSATSGAYYDDINFAGVLPEANDGLDKADMPEPPVIGKFVSLYFTPEKVQGEKLTGDFRPLGEEGYQFDFTVRSNTDKVIQLQIESDSLPSNFKWCLIAPATGVRFMEFPVELHVSGQSLRLLVGSDAFVDKQLDAFQTIPTRFRLHQNYPNPFNSTTTIKMDLPQADRLSIVIFDINGRQVKTLCRRQMFDAGYYKFKWDGHNVSGLPVASGIYFMYLQGTKFKAYQKIILQK